jgi:hypothetical protein
MNVKGSVVKLDKLDKELLQQLQDNFPVVKRPWTNLGKMLGISEDEVLSRIQRLHLFFYSNGDESARGEDGRGCQCR